MITPIRGRKLVASKSPHSYLLLKDDNPDKGTETIKKSHSNKFLEKLKDDNPDKGTETIKAGEYNNARRNIG